MLMKESEYWDSSLPATELPSELSAPSLEHRHTVHHGIHRKCAEGDFSLLWFQEFSLTLSSSWHTLLLVKTLFPVVFPQKTVQFEECRHGSLLHCIIELLLISRSFYVNLELLEDDHAASLHCNSMKHLGAGLFLSCAAKIIFCLWN